MGSPGPGTMARPGSGKGKHGGSPGRNGTKEVVWEGVHSRMGKGRRGPEPLGRERWSTM